VKRFSKGFTIVEILVVIVVISILATIALVTYNGTREQAAISVAQSDMQAFGKALTIYKLDNGTYPTTPEAIGAMMRETGLFGQTRDGTKKALLSVPIRNFSVLSLGIH